MKQKTIYTRINEQHQLNSKYQAESSITNLEDFFQNQFQKLVDILGSIEEAKIHICRTIDNCDNYIQTGNRNIVKNQIDSLDFNRLIIEHTKVITEDSQEESEKSTNE